MHQSRAADLERAIASCHQASTEPSHWETFAEVAARSVGGVDAILFRPGLDPDLKQFVTVTDGLRASHGDYFRHWADRDPWLCAVAGTGFYQVAGEVRFGREFLPDAELRKTAYFNEHVRPAGAGERKLCLKVCDADDPYAPVTHLTINRPFAFDDFDEGDRQCLRILWPHLQRAIRTHWMLQRAHRLPRAAGDALDALPIPVWVLRDDAFIEFANAAARQLERSSLWGSDVRGRLHRIGDLDAAAIREAVKRADSGHTRVFACSADGAINRATLRVAPMAEAAIYQMAWPRAHALLLVELPTASADREWSRELRSRYRLTPAETNVLALLGAGWSVERIATAQSVNASTVRTHLRALFFKTGRRRQSELVRLALGR